MTKLVENNMDNFLLAYKDKFYRFALRMTGNENDAKDIMQELAIKIWQKGAEFDKLNNKEAWCMSVTKNLAIDKIRRNKIRQYDNLDQAYKLADNMHDPGRQVESDDMMDKIKNLINTMPENYKAVLHLREIEEMSYKEIAEILNITIEKVKIYIFRARKMLQKLILDAKLKTV